MLFFEFLLEFVEFVYLDADECGKEKARGV